MILFICDLCKILLVVCLQYAQFCGKDEKDKDLEVFATFLSGETRADDFFSAFLGFFRTYDLSRTCSLTTIGHGSIPTVDDSTNSQCRW